MSTLTTPAPSSRVSVLPSAPRPQCMLKVDLDERCIAFPAAKNLTHLQFFVYHGEKLKVDYGFTYNEAQSTAEFFELKPAAVPEFARKLTEAVYRASSFLMIVGDLNIAFTTHPNGYVIQVGDYARQRDLFIGTACIWRFIGAVCRSADFLATPSTH